MKVLFYGTPEIAVPFLDLLAARETVVGVVSAPDKAVGRGLEVAAPPVKKRASALGLRVFQPEKSSQIAAALQGIDCDLAVVVAYGKILKTEALGLPRLGTLNVHFSLLPKYRGAAPAPWALIKGEAKTGVTLFWLDEGMDSGPIFLSLETAIGPDEDAAELLEKLKTLGLQGLEKVLGEIKAGRVVRQPQSGESTLAPKLTVELAQLSFDRTADEIHNLVRGLGIWPRAFFDLKGPAGPLRVIVLKTRFDQESSAPEQFEPGTVLRVERGGGILIKCGNSSRLWLLTVQVEGKKPVAASDFLNGLRLKPGQRLEVQGV